MTRESELYAPIKAYLESQGYAVKGEVRNCDLVARRGDEPPVIVELKQRFNLELVFQGIDRQRVADNVYLAVGVPAGQARTAIWQRRRRDILRLCRLLGLGLLAVHFGNRRTAKVEAHLDPGPYQPRKSRRSSNLLLKEFEHRVGDPNPGGVNKRPVVTAYRQDALRCATWLDTDGPLQLAVLRQASGVQRAASILQKDVYGWFQRVDRGIYTLSPKGRDALRTYADVVDTLR